MGVVGVEFASLEQGPDDGRAEDEEADGGGDGEQEDEAERAGDGAAEIVHVAAGRAARDGWQRGSADGDAEETEGELHEAEGIAEPAHAAVDLRGEAGIDHDVDLDGGAAEDGRAHEAEDLAEAGVGPIDGRAIGEAAAGECGDLRSELNEAAGEDAPGHAFDGGDAEVGAGDETEREADGERADVKQGRRQRGEGKLVTGVQDAHRLRGQGDEQQERAHNAGETDGEFVLAFKLAEAGGEEVHHLRGEDHADKAEETDDEDDGGGDEVGEMGGFFLRFLVQRFYESGDEGGAESAFGEEVAGEVRDAEAEDVGVVSSGGAEVMSERDFANQAGDTAGEDGDTGDPGRTGYRLTGRYRAGNLGGMAAHLRSVLFKEMGDRDNGFVVVVDGKFLIG